MIDFLRRIWTFVSPYKTRLFLGIVCGVLYELINGALILVIKQVVDVVFPGSEEVTVAQHLQKVQGLWRPLAQNVLPSLPQLSVPSSPAGKALVICTIPAVMLLRGL